MNPDIVDVLRAFVAADVRFLGWVEVDFIGRAAFIPNKRQIGRAKDLADIEGME
jgi:hypothetical protein